MSKVKKRVAESFQSSSKSEVKIEEISNQIKITGIDNNNLDITDVKKVMSVLQVFVNKNRKIELEKEIKDKETNIRLCKENLNFFMNKGNYQYAEETKQSIKTQEQYVQELLKEYNAL